MVAPTGKQIALAGFGYEAVITEGGATLRSLSYDGRPLIDGFTEAEMPTSGKGQLLMPWANRIGDGNYTFEGRTYQLPLSEPTRHNASHGLVRWAQWAVIQRSPSWVVLSYRLMAQSGYPWTLDLRVSYELSEGGLAVAQTAVNLAPTAAPYVSGAHPYLHLGAQVDELEFTLPAATRLITDERKLPTGTLPLDNTDFDYRTPRPLGNTAWDHAVTDLTASQDGNSWVTLKDPVNHVGVALWADSTHRWLQIYTADDAPAINRRSVAVEPMTGPPDAFRSGIDLIRLAAAGSPGDTTTTTWGIVALNA